MKDDTNGALRVPTGYIAREKGIKPYSLRIPSWLKKWIENRANKNRRSVNVEMNVMLEIAQEVIEKQEQATHESA